MVESHLELVARCPRCAGQLVLRVLAEERGRSVQLTLDTACVACGTSPWDIPDQRTLIFTPGAGELKPRPQPEARRESDMEVALREEISRLEGALAEARVELRRAEEATRGEVAEGKRPIEVE
jgi:hypothetical protein